MVGTLKVYPLPSDGALEATSIVLWMPKTSKKTTAGYKFINIWQFKKGQWRATFAISIGHWAIILFTLRAE